MSDDENEQAAELADITEHAAEESTAPETASKGNAIAWLAVLLSLIALTIVGYSAFVDWRAASDESQFASLASIERIDAQLSQSNDAVAALADSIGQRSEPHDFGTDIDALQRDVEERLLLLSPLSARVSTLENSVASLAGISAGARETFLLAEAEYYMQIANAQLQLANNPELAALALGMADERITQLSNPALIEVRRAIADELAALETMKKPDLVGATLTLASLARVVESLPLAGGAQEDGDAENIVAQEKTGAWQSVKDAMGELVRITPPDQAKLVLLSPDAEFFLHNNIAMQLQAARLALLRGEQEVFEQALDDATVLLNTYFDHDSAQVGGATDTINEVRENVFAASPPDISESLTLLRRFMVLREANE